MRADELAGRLGLPVVALRPRATAVDEGEPDLWREDLAGGAIGGNKLRKLEWLLGQARARGAGDVVTLGPAGGQHLLTAAVVGRANGLRVHAVAWPQPTSAAAEARLRALHAHAEHVWPAASKGAAVAVLLRAWATVRVQSGYAPEVWGPGGSDPVGTLGWVQAGLEIAERVTSGALRPPPRVWVPLGSGGTAAGLWLGLAMGGLRTELVAVDITGYGRALVLAQAARVRGLLRRRGVDPGSPGVLRVVATDGRYGHATASSEAAIAVAAARGLRVDGTYGAKAYAVARAEGAGLFVATASAAPLAPLLTSALPALPDRLGRLLVSS